MRDQAACIDVVADDREQAAPVLSALRRQPQASVRIERLAVGDYLIDNRLLFERKTLLDLVQSIKDGRLFAQGLRLASAPQRAALVLEGRARDLNASGMRREAVQGALVTLTLLLGLPLLRAADPDETARLMLTAARQHQAHASGALARHGRRPRGKTRLQSHILQGLPGIGPARARQLLARFGSVEAVIAASAAELSEVPGIGQATAVAIRWAVEEPTTTYGPLEATSPSGAPRPIHATVPTATR